MVNKKEKWIRTSSGRRKLRVTSYKNSIRINIDKKYAGSKRTRSTQQVELSLPAILSLRKMLDEAMKDLEIYEVISS